MYFHLRHLYKITKNDCQLSHVCLSVRLYGKTRLPLGQVLMKFCLIIFRKICRERRIFIKNLTRMAGTLHEDRCTFTIISCRILLKLRNISEKLCTENQNTCFLFYNISFFFPPRKRFPVADNLKKKTLEPDRPQMTIIQRMRIPCWIYKVTNTHLEYVKLIAFRLQLGYTYNACLLSFPDALCSNKYASL